MTASGRGGEGVEGWSKKEKGLMDMDNRVVMAEGRGYKGTKWKKFSKEHTYILKAVFIYPPYENKVPKMKSNHVTVLLKN